MIIRINICDQAVLDRICNILAPLAPSLLKVRLLSYCYGEVYEESMLLEARSIIGSWQGSPLTPAQREIIEELQNIEDNQYPFEILEE